MLDLNTLVLEKLDRDGVNTLVEWAKREGWNPGAYDYDVFWQTDPDGFCGFYVEDRLIAGGAIVSYGGAYGFMGLFIVHPDYRGLGIGQKLWHLRRDRLLARLDASASIGMDGVVAMQPFYAKGGFAIAFKDERYACMGYEVAVHPNVAPIAAKDYDAILAYDTSCFGVPRPTFLSPWLAMPNGKAFKYEVDQKLQGFAVLRQVDPGYKIGPLFADNEAIAEALYQACLNSAAGESVYLDIPMINEGAVRLVQKYGATYVFECARMYYGEAPAVDINKVYGITTFELG